MKSLTHAWLVFKAMERLEKASLSARDYYHAESLVLWFKANSHGVEHGVRYPDEVMKDNAHSHVRRFGPEEQGSGQFRKLPPTQLLYQTGLHAPLYGKNFRVEEQDNLPLRCEALAHAAIDGLKMLAGEEKGSPVAPTVNYVAVLFCMLGHYVADAHMPFHCDRRRFSEGFDLHGHIEEEWEDAVRKYYPVEKSSGRFLLNAEGYPRLEAGQDYGSSFLESVELEMEQREFIGDWGDGNRNVAEYIEAVCQYSYLLAYSFIPPDFDETNVTASNWHALPGQNPSLLDIFSHMVFADTIDSIARVWLRVWKRYKVWEEEGGKGTDR